MGANTMYLQQLLSVSAGGQAIAGERAESRLTPMQTPPTPKQNVVVIVLSVLCWRGSADNRL